MKKSVVACRGRLAIHQRPVSCLDPESAVHIRLMLPPAQSGTAWPTISNQNASKRQNLIMVPPTRQKCGKKIANRKATNEKTSSAIRSARRAR